MRNAGFRRLMFAWQGIILGGDGADIVRIVEQKGVCLTGCGWCVDYG